MHAPDIGLDRKRAQLQCCRGGSERKVDFIPIKPEITLDRTTVGKSLFKKRIVRSF